MFLCCVYCCDSRSFNGARRRLTTRGNETFLPIVLVSRVLCVYAPVTASLRFEPAGDAHTPRHGASIRQLQLSSDKDILSVLLFIKYLIGLASALRHLIYVSPIMSYLCECQCQ